MATKGDVFFPDRIENGQFISPQVLRLMAELNGRHVEVCIRERRGYGGLPMHRFYRGRVIAMIGEYLREQGNDVTNQEVHKEMAGMYLRRTVLDEEGNWVEKVISTADLADAEFAHYIRQVIEHARFHYDLEIPDSDQTGDIRIA